MYFGFLSDVPNGAKLLEALANVLSDYSDLTCHCVKRFFLRGEEEARPNFYYTNKDVVWSV